MPRKRPTDFDCILGGQRWRVIFVRRGHPKVPESWGMCYWTEKEIYVRYDLSEKNYIDVLAHELLHANCHLTFVAEEWVTYTATEMATAMLQAGIGRK